MYKAALTTVLMLSQFTDPKTQKSARIPAETSEPI